MLLICDFMKTSVIIPVYNSEKTIGKCLDSLMNQTKKPDEIIVVDDRSEDRTSGIVKIFKNVILLEKDHEGPAAARNLGAKKAKGDILLFIDSDCIADKNWVSEMVKPFKRKGTAGVQGIYETKQKGLISRFVQLEIEDRYDRMKKFETLDFVGSYSAGYRKRIFLEFKGFDESFPIASGEDPELFDFLKSLETLKGALKKKGTLILSTDSELFKHLDYRGYSPQEKN